MRHVAVRGGDVQVADPDERGFGGGFPFEKRPHAFEEAQLVGVVGVVQAFPLGHVGVHHRHAAQAPPDEAGPVVRLMPVPEPGPDVLEGFQGGDGHPRGGLLAAENDPVPQVVEGGRVELRILHLRLLETEEVDSVIIEPAR